MRSSAFNSTRWLPLRSTASRDGLRLGQHAPWPRKKPQQRISAPTAQSKAPSVSRLTATARSSSVEERGHEQHRPVRRAQVQVADLAVGPVVAEARLQPLHLVQRLVRRRPGGTPGPDLPGAPRTPSPWTRATGG